MGSVADRITLRTLLGTLAATLAAGAAHSQAAHTSMGETPPLFDGLGRLHHAITTTVPLAQRYFDQGLTLVYAFNHEEAIASFTEAARLDSTCAMCYWGIALALGPNINVPMDSAAGVAAYAAVRRAIALRAHATPREREYIDALATRYASPPPAQRGSLDSAYANAMRTLARHYPADPDAATLFAEAMLDLRPWDQWASDGTPKPGTLEAVATLERVLARVPDHPGACHYYIHAIEASRHPERALPCARELPKLVPAAGHLVHMPAHLYFRLGRYAEAAESNEHAVHTDEHYLEGRHPRGPYPFYYAHNLEFLWAAASMDGRSADAIRAARQVAAWVTRDLVRAVPLAEHFVPTPYFALVRFGKWREMLAEPAPPADYRYALAMWYYARGMALAATGELAAAREALDSLIAVSATVPPSQPVGTNTAAAVLRIARPLLEGTIASRRGNFTLAIARLREAVRYQDGLLYDEPPAWYFPVRQALGATLLAAGRTNEAIAVYREDLARNPNNGWSLYGLARALRAAGRVVEASAAEHRWREAWRRADVQLAASVF